MDVTIQITRFSTKEELACGAVFLQALSESPRLIKSEDVSTMEKALKTEEAPAVKIEEAPVVEDATPKAKKKATKKTEVAPIQPPTPLETPEAETEAEIKAETPQSPDTDVVPDEEIADFKNYIRDSIAKLVKLKKITSDEQFVSRVVELADNKKMIDLTVAEFTALRNATIDLVKGFIDGTV
jgi:hypothetical protein